MRKQLLLLVQLTLFPFLLFAQSNEPDPTRVDLVPPAPEAASLGKFIDMPVNIYTGTPQIEVPIYNLQSYELQIPIKLKYHPSGLKVDEIPSSVGAGWALAAASTVSRTIRGFQDEKGVLGYMSSSISGLYASGNFFNMDGTINENYMVNNVNVVGRLSACNTTLDDSDASKNIFVAAHGGVDLEPDIFFYSLPSGESGQFYFDRNGEVQVVDQSPLNYSFQKTGDIITSWEIEGLDGTKYYFDKYDNSNSSSTCKGNNDLILDVSGNSIASIPDVNAPTSWHLTKMVSASGKDSIEFIYTQETLSYSQTISVTDFEPILYASGDIESSICSNSTTVSGWALTEIRAANGYKIFFDRSTSRSDLSGGKELDAIEIKYNNQLIKDYELTQSYNQGLLMLDDISQCKNGNPCLPPYTFEYYPLSGSSVRTTYNTDHWGYFNGANNGSLYAPEMIYDGKYYTGADREPNILRAREGTLMKITYPTGGTTELFYELHRYSNYPYHDYYQFDPTLTSLATPLQHTIPDSQNPPSFTDSETFTLNEPTDIIIKCTVPEVNEAVSGGIEGGILADVGFWLRYPDPSDDTPYVINGPRNPEIITLPAGTYTVELDFDPADMHWQGIPLEERKFYFEVLKVVPFDETSLTEGFKGGGLRIQRIKQTGSSSFEKTYHYGDENGKSSGKLISFPNYVNNFLLSYDQWVIGQGCADDREETFLTRTNTTNIPLSSTSGSSVGYDRVLVYEGTQALNSGYSEYRYTNFIDEQITYGLFGPRIPNRSFSYKNGLLTSQRSFRQDGKLMQLDSSNYTFINPMNIGRGLIIKLLYNTACKFCMYYQYEYGIYTQPSELVRKSKSFSWTYDQNFDGELLAESEYTYNQYNQVIKSKTRTSKSDRWVVNDIAYHSTDHTLPEKSYSYYEDPQEKRFNKGVDFTYTATLKPDEVRLANPVNQVTTTPSTVSYETRLNYGSYNTFDKPLSYYKSDNISSSLIWGYEGNFVLAQAINAEPSDIAYSSFEEASIGGNWAISSGTANFDVNGEAHTGKKLLSTVGTVVVTKSGLSSSRTYLASFWAKGTNTIAVSGHPSLNGSSSWKFYTIEISGISDLSLTFNSHMVDELRFHPLESQMTTYSYDPVVGVIATTDPNSKAMIYSYDSFNRLEWVKDVRGEIIQKLEYQYDSGN